MMHHSHPFGRLLITGFIAVVLLPLAGANPFRTVQIQTKEPPLPGEQPAPPLPRPPLPVPVVPAPVLPPPAIGIPCPPVDPPAPLVTLRMRVLACSLAGQELEYRICVENKSPAPAHHVLVRNPLPANARYVRAHPEPSGMEPDLVWVFGTLHPGEGKEIVLVLAPTDTADVKNCARVQFEHGQCVVTRIAGAPPIILEPKNGKEVPKDKGPPRVIPPGDAKLSLKITGPKQQYANLPAKYQITITNTGEAAADNLLVTAFLPEKSVFLGASDNGRFHLSQVAWLLGNLAPGASKTVQVSYRMSQAGEFCLKATALADRQARAEAEYCTKFEGVSALLLEVVDTKDPVEVGGQTSYRIILYNQGTASITNIQINAQVPPELMLVRATGPTSPPPPEKLPPRLADGQQVAFEPLKELKAGERQIYEVFAKAVKAGDARFRVVLTADQLKLGGPVMEEESTTIFREDDPGRPPPGPPGLQTKR
jgi:uncharacterized repeat protein (TIGR01451 family)